MSTITTERLTKILSETQAVISECNSRGVHGSVEVNARLFENLLMELLLHRAAMLQGADQPQNAPQNIPEKIPARWRQWIIDVVEYLENGLEVDGELEAQGSVDAKRLLAAAPLQEVKQCT